MTRPSPKEPASQRSRRRHAQFLESLWIKGFLGLPAVERSRLTSMISAPRRSCLVCVYPSGSTTDTSYSSVTARVVDARCLPWCERTERVQLTAPPTAPAGSPTPRRRPSGSASPRSAQPCSERAACRPPERLDVSPDRQRSYLPSMLSSAIPLGIRSRSCHRAGDRQGCLGRARADLP